MFSRIARSPHRPSHAWRIPLARSFSALPSSSNNVVRIVEVSPRDGLQNEKAIIEPRVKVELINRLARAGLQIVESGSFVSPKWVPQMAGTAEVLTEMEKLPGVRYPVLVPNDKGLDALFEHFDKAGMRTTDEIAVFTAATDAFNKANTNTTVAESLIKLEAVSKRAKENGLRVRGYVSVVVVCPFSGKVEPVKVRDVSRALLDMGCYEVSLGDTVGMGTPTTIERMIESVKESVPADKLAGHFHDTYGMAIANVWTALGLGIRTIDSSIAGLGGCPYSPGATGNVATEDVLYALSSEGSPYTLAGNPNVSALVDTGFWISGKLGRVNASRAATARRAGEERKKKEAEKQKAKL